MPGPVTMKASGKAFVDFSGLWVSPHLLSGRTITDKGGFNSVILGHLTFIRILFSLMTENNALRVPYAVLNSALFYVYCMQGPACLL